MAEQSLITSGLDESHILWEEQDGQIRAVGFKNDGEKRFQESLSESKNGGLEPVLSEELYNELVEDARKKAALEAFLKERSRITYEAILKDLIAKQMVDNLIDLIGAMDGDCLNEFTKDKEFKEKFNNLTDSGSPKYEDLCEFYKLFSKLANEKKIQFESEKDHNAKSYNSIKRSLDQIGLLYSYDIPKLAQGMNSVLTLNESKHIKNTKKKSWFKRFVDKVKVFLGIKTQEQIEQELHRLGSMEKAATKIVGDSVVGGFNNNAKDFSNFLKANKASRLKRENGERINFSLPATEMDTKKTTVASVSKMGVVKGAAKVATMAVTGIAAENDPFGKIAQFGVNEEIQAGTLADHINDAFTFEAKKQAFETMMQFTKDMYVIADQLYASGDDKKIAEGMPLKALGFERLQDPEFSDFITRLSKSLGFDIKAYQKANPDLGDVDDVGIAVHFLFNADESMREEAFKQFVAGNEEEGIGLQFASDAFNKEFNKMKSAKESEIADSDNYFYLLDLNKQVIEDLWMKSITKNAVHTVLKATNIEEKYYNPDAKGATTRVTAALKQQLVESLPACMESYMGSAAQKRELAQKMSSSYCQGIKEEYDRRYEEAHPTEVSPQEKTYLELANDYFWWFAGYDTAESQPKNKFGKPPLYARSIEDNKSKWEAAEARVKEAGVPIAVRNELTEIVRKKTNEVWQKQAKHTIKTILDWGEEDFLKAMNETLTLKYIELKEQQAHPKLLAEVESQLSVLADVTENYASNPDFFMEMDLEKFKIFSNAIHSAVTIEYSKGEFENIDKQADLYMAMMALNQLNSIYLTPEIALRLYEDVLPTDFDEIPTGEMSAISKAAISKVAEIGDKMFKDAMSGPIKQFEYFAEQRANKKHTLSPGSEVTSPIQIPSITDDSNQTQSWTSWGAEWLSWGINTSSEWITWGAGTGWSLFSGTASFSANAISRYTNLNLSDIKTSEELNQILVDTSHEYIRGEFFDSSSHVVMELYDLIRCEEKFEYLQGLIGDDQEVNPFAEYGFGDKKSMLKFIDALAQDLGFENAKDLYELKGSDSREDLAKLGSLKSSFEKVRKTEEQKMHDPFVSAKLTIRAENQRLIKKSKKKGSKKLQNAENYMVVMSSLDTMTCAVELAQRETLAVEMLMPEADKMLGFNKEQAGLWDALMAAGEQKAKEYGNDKLRQGIAAQLSDSITRANHFPTAMINAVADNLDSKLAQSYSATVIEEDVIDEFIAKTGSTEQAISFFEQQIPENIRPYVIIALGKHMVRVHQPECSQQLLALEKKALGSVDELEFWKDLMLNAFEEQNHDFAAVLIAEHIPMELSGKVISSIVDEFEKDSKISMDVMLTILRVKPEKFADVHLDLIRNINYQCDIDYDLYDKNISVTQRGWSQMVSDNDGKVLDNIREIYVFMDNLRQQLEMEMKHIQEELDKFEKGTELTALQIQAHAYKLELYESVLGDFEGIKELWMAQEQKGLDGNIYSLSNVPLQTKTRKDENTAVWDEQINKGLDHAANTLTETQKVLDATKKKLGIGEKPEINNKSQVSLNEEPQRKTRSRMH